MNKSHRKGQESMLNIMAIVIIVSVIFLYFFYVTQSQRVESSKIMANEQKYRYAEIVMTNMYYIKPDGSDATIAEIVGKALLFGDRTRNYVYLSRNRKVAPRKVVENYLDLTLTDYNYYFFVENEGMKSFDVGEGEAENARMMAHELIIPLPDSKENARAYLYVW